MRYISTRGRAPELGFCDALLAGLATDGGLYVPQTWPIVNAPTSGSYADRAAAIMQPFIGTEIDAATMARLSREAYSSFRHPDVVPLVQIAPEHYLLELFHGPTLAFKDVALQLIGRLFDHVLSQRNQRVMIVGATSGDTGSAAIDGVKSCNNVDIVILYPRGRVSDVQRRQMTTVDAPTGRVSWHKLFITSLRFKRWVVARRSVCQPETLATCSPAGSQNRWVRRSRN